MHYMIVEVIYSILNLFLNIKKKSMSQKNLS